MKPRLVLRVVFSSALLLVGALEARAEPVRTPIELARVLAARYPAQPSMSYIPALAWTGSFELSRRAGDSAFRDRAVAQMQPFLAGTKPAIGASPSLASLAGHLAFAEWGRREQRPDATALAVKAMETMLADPANPTNPVRFATRWTDDMFMAASVLARVAAAATNDPRPAVALQQLLTGYAARLQRADGLFVHAQHAPYAWGRGNGFAAFGLMEALTHLPADWTGREAVLSLYRKHMKAMLAHQTDDGSWRQVVDEPAAYREFTVTAMTLTAMARGLRMGWIAGDEYASAVARAWLAVQARVSADGALSDVCTGTGAGRDANLAFYLNRPAINGPDDRGGAMALTAALEYDALLAGRRTR